MALDIARMIADVIEEAYTKSQQIRQRAEVLEDLKTAGIEVENPYGLVRWGYTNVARTDLPRVRKAVGRLSMNGKSCAWNFKETNELEVSLKPVDTTKPVLFKYRCKFRKGGKCRVIEEVSAPTVYPTLVCDR